MQYGKVLYSVSQKNAPCGFLTFFPKRMGIFNQFFTHILHVPFYTRLQIFIQLAPTLMMLCQPYKAQPPNEFLHFNRSLTSKFVFCANDVTVDVMSHPTCLFTL